jgi:hypothetical protein
MDEMTQAVSLRIGLTWQFEGVPALRCPTGPTSEFLHEPAQCTDRGPGTAVRYSSAPTI